MSGGDPAGCSPLRLRLLRLQSRFTWNLQESELDLENLSTRLQDHIGLGLGTHGTPRSYSFLAYVRFLQGAPEEAQALLDQSQQELEEVYGPKGDRRLLVTYGDQAWLSYHRGDFVQAESYCQRVEDILLKFPPSSPTGLHPEVLGEKAWTYLKFSRSYYPKAAESFRQALEQQGEDSEWNAGYAIVLFRTEPREAGAPEGGGESPAVRQLRRALRISPQDGVLLAMLALKQAGGGAAEAEALAERALAADPENPHVMRYIAKYLRTQGEHDRSIELLKRAVSITNESAFIHHQLALCYKKKRAALRGSNRREARKCKELCIFHLEEAIRIKPSFLLALADLAQLHGEEKNLSRAEDLFQKGLQMIPEVSEKSTRQVLHQRYAHFNLFHNGDQASGPSPTTP
ncbi:LOW QUALITY PROTEIN: interferon-induced protein with tetratricopeptide repeats 1-like, partial [Menidia menidia]